MGDPKQTTAKQELIAFHAAIGRMLEEVGRRGVTIPLREWESMMAKALNVMTRQTAADKTWAMERLGLIIHKKKEGVIVLDAT
jgi:hypothetical protein